MVARRPPPGLGWYAVSSTIAGPPVQVDRHANGQGVNGQGVTAVENRAKVRFGAKLKSSKTEHSGYQN